MTQRITRTDLGGMLLRLQRNLQTHRLIHSTDSVLTLTTGDHQAGEGGWGVLTLTTGSQLYGNAYHVGAIEYVPGQPHGIDAVHSQPFGTFHFGFTARDCYDRMHALCVAYETLPARPELYAVTAVEEGGKQYPTFYLDTRVQGIVSEAHAADIAHEIVPTASVCAVRV